MAIFHFTVTQTKRSKGQSAIASAAYRSGERLYSEYYGEYSDYTRKGGVIKGFCIIWFCRNLQIRAVYSQDAALSEKINVFTKFGIYQAFLNCYEKIPSH